MSLTDCAANVNTTFVTESSVTWLVFGHYPDGSSTWISAHDDRADAVAQVKEQGARRDPNDADAFMFDFVWCSPAAHFIANI